MYVTLCPELKRLPMGSQSAPRLSKFHVEKEWLEGLEWEDETIKSRLSSLVVENFLSKPEYSHLRLLHLRSEWYSSLSLQQERRGKRAEFLPQADAAEELDCLKAPNVLAIGFHGVPRFVRIHPPLFGILAGMQTMPLHFLNPPPQMWRSPLSGHLALNIAGPFSPPNRFPITLYIEGDTARLQDALLEAQHLPSTFNRLWDSVHQHPHEISSFEIRFIPYSMNRAADSIAQILPHSPTVYQYECQLPAHIRIELIDDRSALDNKSHMLSSGSVCMLKSPLASQV